MKHVKHCSWTTLKNIHMNKPGLFSPIFFAVCYAYMEIVFHIFAFQDVIVWFPVLFAIPVGIFIGAVCNLFSEKITRILRYVFTAAPAILFSVQVTYNYAFHSFMSVSQAGMAGDVMGNFFNQVMEAIWKCLIPILLMFIPTVSLIFLHKTLNKKRKFKLKRTVYNFVIFALVQIIVILMLPLGGKGEHSAWANYHNNWVLDLSMEKLGLFTTTGIDVKYFFFGGLMEEEDEIDVPDAYVPVIPEPDTPNVPDVPDDPDDPVVDVPLEYGDNVISGLDFAALGEAETDKTAKKIYNYLASVQPSKKNEYTGMFEGYNLIFITAESFSEQAIHPELTPTLYELANSGFNFTNYWATYPSNTTNGEYTNLTGLMPDISKPKQNGSFVYSIRNTMNMNIANWFNAQGVTSRAYHNYVGSYYNRQKTHPNLGYVFKGKMEIGNLPGWPSSDLVMVERTVDEYINDDWFHTYYMTFSGHHSYQFGGVNNMVDKNKKLVDGYKEMSTEQRAYLSCNIELDKAVEFLIARLKLAGKLDKTVIVITTDHYPYGLTDASWKKMIGHSLQWGGLERHKSDLIIWNSAMETVTVDKPCSNPDVLPTLLNLFGFEYDSRLYSGTDILSDSPGLAMTANQSFVTDKIIYNSRYEKVYKLDESYELPENYLETYIQVVKNRFSIAASMLTNDFFSRLPEDVIADAQRGDNERTPYN